MDLGAKVSGNLIFLVKLIVLRRFRAPKAHRDRFFLAISCRSGAPTADLREKNFCQKSGSDLGLEKSPQKGVIWHGKWPLRKPT
jgi:hypothetical protein